jgi:SagB-type dehydrogenase family enzyme
MTLEEFLHDLHYDIDKVRPPDVEPDWDDAPLAYKLYRGQPSFPLSLDVPLSLEGERPPAEPKLREFGHFLWYVYGITQVSQSLVSLGEVARYAHWMHTYRRFVPSGGGLYPSELYVYLKLEDLPNGVYHYDVIHHRLVLLREGNYDAYLGRALGNRCDVSSCFATVFVSTMFWKNFFKYDNFSYRLQGLDAGALIGQLLEVGKRFGYTSGVYFQFLDRAVNHLLGLVAQEESVYAVIPLSTEPTSRWFGIVDNESSPVTASKLCLELPDIHPEHYVRSRRIRNYPAIIRVNESAFMESTESFRTMEETVEEGAPCIGQVVAIPPVNRLSFDLASACRTRYSPGMDFQLKKVSDMQLASLLSEAIASFQYHNDLDKGKSVQPRVSLYGCFVGVEGIPDGAYHYESDAHTLRLLRAGDHRGRLQQGMTMHNVNLHQVPLCLHVAGHRHHLIHTLGSRGYRIQQMEVGMLVQRLLLTASALGMGGHPLLGYETDICDELYQFASNGLTCLIQIPVGPYRTGSRLEGRLHS